jgi:hypothetical protein
MIYVFVFLFRQEFFNIILINNPSFECYTTGSNKNDITNPGRPLSIHTRVPPTQRQRPTAPLRRILF